MNVEEVDAELAHWQSDVDKLYANLLELQNNISFLDGRELTGVTRERQLKAKQADSRLWIYVDLYLKLVNKIKEKRAALPNFGRGKLLEEIEQLFKGPSIDLPAEEVALAERGLFSDSQKVEKLTVPVLRRTMESDFQILRDFYVQAQDAWQSGGNAIAELEKEVTGLTNEARQYGRESADEIAQLRARLESTTKRWRLDPLGVPRDLRRDLEPYIKAARSLIGRLSSERSRLASDVALLSVKLEEVKARRVIALQQYQACSARLDSPESAKQPPSTRTLGEKLEALKQLLSDKKWAETQQGLADWHNHYQKISNETESAIAFNQALLHKVDGLKRRIQEAVSKYNDYTARGMEAANSVKVFTSNGEQLLEGKVNLDQAERIVIALEVKVGELCTRFDQRAT